MTANEIIQAVLTIGSSAGVLTILSLQIKSQKDQIEAMKSNMDSMKSYMDIFKVDELEKYVEVIKKTSKADAKLIAMDLYQESMKSKEFSDMVANMYHDLFEKTIDKQLRESGQELFDNTIDALASFDKDERIEIIKEKYPINEKAILEEFEDIELNNPEFLTENRQMFLENSTQKLQTVEEQKQIEGNKNIIKT